MKILIATILSGTICISCNNTETKSSSGVNSNTTVQSKPTIPNDTTIEYSIIGISSEGASAMAKYAEGKLKECTISIYGETGQNRIFYAFNGDKIDVVEKQLTYKGTLEKTKSDKDMELKKEIKYVLDLNGKVIGKADEGRTDIFGDFKKVVPLEIK